MERTKNMKVRTKPAKCRTKGCKNIAQYAGYCRQCLNPLLGVQPDKPLRYWPPAARETATVQPDETREGRRI